MPRYGASASRSIAATIRVRSGLATRLSSFAALSLILTEKLTPDPVPVELRIARIAKPVNGNGEVVEIFEIVLNGQANDLRTAAPELPRGGIERVDNQIRQSCGDLLGHGIPGLLKVSDSSLLQRGSGLNSRPRHPVGWGGPVRHLRRPRSEWAGSASRTGRRCAGGRSRPRQGRKAPTTSAVAAVRSQAPRWNPGVKDAPLPHRENPVEGRHPGIGPITALALEAFAPPMEGFRRGRDFSAWLGLVPRQHTTGGKPRLGRIPKMGQRDLGRLLITGAMTVVRHAARGGEKTDPWLDGMLERKSKKVVAVALANRMARRVWVLATRKETYRVHPAA